VIDIGGVELRRLGAHPDSRGTFVEILRARDHPESFLQANHSRSRAGVLRGLHFHRHQADLWYVVSGRIRVGLADLREKTGEPRRATVELDGSEPTTLYMPAGVAHGFVALTDVDMIYFVTHEYDTEDEFGVAWDDPTLGIDWRVDSPILSDRDRSNPKLDWQRIPEFS
jgi:dTDP-4-dehydrorhamnose 3,5-epimerase